MVISQIYQNFQCHMVHNFHKAEYIYTCTHAIKYLFIQVLHVCVSMLFHYHDLTCSYVYIPTAVCMVKNIPRI